MSDEHEVPRWLRVDGDRRFSALHELCHMMLARLPLEVVARGDLRGLSDDDLRSLIHDIEAVWEDKS